MKHLIRYTNWVWEFDDRQWDHFLRALACGLEVERCLLHGTYLGEARDYEKVTAADAAATLGFFKEFVKQLRKDARSRRKAAGSRKEK